MKINIDIIQCEHEIDFMYSRILCYFSARKGRGKLTRYKIFPIKTISHKTKI